MKLNGRLCLERDVAEVFSLAQVVESAEPFTLTLSRNKAGEGQNLTKHFVRARAALPNMNYSSNL